MTADVPKERVLSPTKVTAWLDCAHYLNLSHLVADGSLAKPDSKANAFAQLLMDKGVQHEQECLEHYKDSGLSVYEVPAKEAGETFAAWVERVGNPMEYGHDVVYQMPFVHEGIRGVADFLVRGDPVPNGAVPYEPVDAKLARSDAKPGHVLQLLFYAEAIEALTGVGPQFGHVSLGSGDQLTVRLSEVDAYWRRLQRQLRDALAADPTSGTTPEKCAHCDFCEFFDVCSAEWRANDSLVYVAGVRTAERRILEDSGVATMAGLAVASGEPDFDMAPERLKTLATQAGLQVDARGHPDEKPPFRPLDSDDQGVRGVAALPKPDDGDIFLDFEGHPFWRPDRGLLFLFGLIRQDEPDEWGYEQRWAHSPDEEAAATRSLIGYLYERRAKYPGMHVYHYNHTERSSLVSLVAELENLVAEHGLAGRQLVELIDAGVFVDLLMTVRHSVQVGIESYGLKEVERLTDYERAAGIEKGAGAVVEYESYMDDGEPDRLNRIASYNQDDVRATKEVRDWLVAQREEGLDWPEPALAPAAPEDDKSPKGQAELLEYPEGSPQHLLAHLLDYWWREARFDYAERIARLEAANPDDPKTITGLVSQGSVAPTGSQRTARHGFSFPLQEVDGSRLPSVSYLSEEGSLITTSVTGLDAAGRHLELRWGDTPTEVGTIPRVVTLYDWVSPAPKPEALEAVAAAMLDITDTSRLRAARALIERQLPRFLPGSEPAEGMLAARLDEVLDLPRSTTARMINGMKTRALLVLLGGLFVVAGGAIGGSGGLVLGLGLGLVFVGGAYWFRDKVAIASARVMPADLAQYPDYHVGQLDESFLAIQGPPGTGKTWTGARIIHGLVTSGHRVGITAFSHAAIDNLLREVVKVFAEAGGDDDLSAIRRVSEVPVDGLEGVEYTKNNNKCMDSAHNLVAGTTWLFARPDMRANPVDFLVIDEAGQLGLADALAAASGSKNVVLLGDPQQLSQVTKASHLVGSGASVLEHVLGGEATIPKDRGVFLDVTYRMHPDVCTFISGEIYDGRLVPHPDCSQQGTEHGTGLRWVRATHQERSTDSEEEATIVVDTITGLLGSDWTDAKGNTRALGVSDFMVVAPFNDQVRLIRRRLDANPVTAGVPVGTVDKFQGQEAPVVVFSMTSSDAEHIPHSMKFLFSRKRLNVALSRARCLAYLVGTEELLNSRARDIDEMKLISTLCAFVEEAERQQ